MTSPDRADTPVDRDYAARLAADLVRIDSVNPSLVAGARGEADVAEYTTRAMEALGLTVTTHEPEPGRISVVGRLRGSGGGRSLMLNAHYDTVGVAEMPDPFSGTVRDGRLYGRGAYDMKGSLAACLAAAKGIRDSGMRLRGDLMIAAVADEEFASIGTADLIGRYDVDGAVVTEPTQLDVCLAHKGFVWLEIETIGRAAHGSRPEEGVDANLRMGRVLAEIQKLERELRERPKHALVGGPSVHAATLHGGTGLSTYAARCTLGIERRTIPGETRRAVEAEFRRLLARLEREDDAFESSLLTTMVRDPFEVKREAPIVQAVAGAVQEILGRPARYVGDTPWMDAALLANAGIETVVIGPSGGGAHAREEWVDLDSVAQLAAVLAGTAKAYCG